MKHCKGRKSVTVITSQSDMSYSTLATILKSESKVTETCKGFTSLKVTRLTKIEKGLH
jgi:hypothetical protein